MKNFFTRLLIALESIAESLECIKQSITSMTANVDYMSHTVASGFKSTSEDYIANANLISGAINSLEDSVKDSYRSKVSDEQEKDASQSKWVESVVQAIKTMKPQPIAPQPTEKSSDLSELAKKARACLSSTKKNEAKVSITKTGKVRAPRKVETKVRKPYGDRYIIVTHPDWNGDVKAYNNVREALEMLNLNVSQSKCHRMMKNGKPIEGYTFTREK